MIKARRDAVPHFPDLVDYRITQILLHPTDYDGNRHGYFLSMRLMSRPAQRSTAERSP